MDAKTTNKRIETIQLCQLKPAGYQRATKTSQVNAISKNFSEAKLGLPLVSERGGDFFLIDGQHRVAALRNLGYTSMNCLVLTGLSYEDEANLFRSQNDCSRRITALNAYKAGLEAQDIECTTISDIVVKHGFTVGGKGVNGIGSVFALSTVYKVFGHETLDSTLEAIRETWPDEPMAVKRHFIVGIAEFLCRFRVSVTDFSEKLGIYSPASVWRKYAEYADNTCAASNDPTLRRAFCKSLVYHYNKSIRYRRNWLKDGDQF